MDIRRTDMALLVSLNALLREKSVTGAARRLGISQPAMSAQLQKLRDLLDDPILVTEGNRMVATARIATLADPLQTRLAELHALVFQPKDFDPQTARRTFRVAATDYSHLVILPHLIECLRRLAPGIRVSALPFPAHDLRARLAEDVDCVIASERMIDETLPARRLFEDRLVFVSRSNHPLVHGEIDLDVFCSLDHLLVSPDGGCFTGVVDDVLEAHGTSRTVVASLPNFFLVPRALRESNCVAVLPTKVVDLDPSGLDTAELPIDVDHFPVFMSWHPRASHDPGHTWLRSVISSLNFAA